MQSNFDIFHDAIVEKRRVIGTYAGYPREVCPHTLGHSTNGELKVLTYQYGGGSSSGLEPPGSTENWRCLNVEEFAVERVEDGEWHSHSHHSRPATCIPLENVIVSVDF